MLQHLIRSVIPLLAMESSQVELAAAYQRADVYIDELLALEDDQTRSAAKEQLKCLIYESRDSRAIASEKLDQLLIRSNTKELARVLATKARAKLVFGTDCTFNPLPDTIGSLTEEDMRQIYFFNVPEQTNGWTCGYWGVYNAKAILELYESGACISNSAITERAREFYAQRFTHIDEIGKEYASEKDRPHVKEKPGIEVLVKLAQYLDTNNPGKNKLAPLLHFITYLRNGEQPTFSEYDPAVWEALGVHTMIEACDLKRPGEEKKRIIAKKFVENFRKDHIIFFLCFLYDPAEHWVLSPIIQLGEPNTRAVMPLVDSYNFPIFSGGDAVEVVDFVYKTILHPAPEKENDL